MATSENSDRLRKMLRRLADEYPGIYETVDELRFQRGKTLPKWAEWCFLPMAGAAAIVSESNPIGMSFEKIADVARISALSSWRLSQGIYRFHPETFKSIAETPLTGDLPTELIYRMPEWCVYIELQGESEEKPNSRDYGFFAHLEDDVERGHPELRILVDSEKRLLPVIIHLDKPTLREAVLETFSEIKSRNLAPADRYEASDENKEKLIKYAERLVGLLLYLCSNGVDLTLNGKGGVKASTPWPKKTKNGWRFFPPDHATVWEVGFRIGQALEAAREREATQDHGGAQASPRPHIRRAHWHSFWKGPIKEPSKRHLVVYWLPPLAVGLKEIDDLVNQSDDAG